MTDRIPFLLLLGALIACYAIAAPAQAISDSDLVARFFPQSLLDVHVADYPDLPPKKDVAFTNRLKQ